MAAVACDCTSAVARASSWRSLSKVMSAKFTRTLQPAQRTAAAAADDLVQAVAELQQDPEFALLALDAEGEAQLVA